MKFVYKFDIYVIYFVSCGNLYIDVINGEVFFYDVIIKYVEIFGFEGKEIVIVKMEEEFCKIINDIENYSLLVIGIVVIRYSGI